MAEIEGHCSDAWNTIAVTPSKSTRGTKPDGLRCGNTARAGHTATQKDLHYQTVGHHLNQHRGASLFPPAERRLSDLDAQKSGRRILGGVNPPGQPARTEAAGRITHRRVMTKRIHASSPTSPTMPIQASPTRAVAIRLIPHAEDLFAAQTASNA